MGWAGDVNLDEKATVNGTMTLGFGQAQLDGGVAGDLLAYGGEIGVNGVLGHNAMIHAGHVTIGAKAEIKGQTKVEAHEQPDVSPTARLGSPMEFTLEKRGPEKRCV